MLKKNVLTVFVIIGIALSLAGVSALVFPDWLKISGGWLILLGAAIVGVAKIGGDLNNWREFLYGKGDDQQQKNQTLLSKNSNLQPGSIIEPTRKPLLPNQKLAKELSMESSDNLANVNIAALRQQISQVFDDPQIDAICMDHFPEVFGRFSRGMRKDEKISLLLDYCRRLPARLDKLVNMINHYQK